MCSSRTPPVPWTIAFGGPVVPEENITNCGWSKGSRGHSASATPCTVPTRSESRTAGTALPAGRAKLIEDDELANGRQARE